MTAAPPARTPLPAQLLERVRKQAADSGVFASVDSREGMLVCRAKDAAAPASYRVFVEGGRAWVSLVMADRWLSESIEADLMHTGDHMEDLIEEELVELGMVAGRPAVEHFRSEDLLFTFRSPVVVPSGALEGPEAARLVGATLLAYEAAFRPLGDMAAGDEAA